MSCFRNRFSCRRRCKKPSVYFVGNGRFGPVQYDPTRSQIHSFVMNIYFTQVKKSLTISQPKYATVFQHNKDHISSINDVVPLYKVKAISDNLLTPAYVGNSGCSALIFLIRVTRLKCSFSTYHTYVDFMGYL